MKINWKVRFQNKTWIAAFTAAVIAFVYQVLSLFDIVPPVSQATVSQVIDMLLTILVMLGVVIDPTTKEVNDSERAMRYTVPGGEENDE